MVEGSVDGGGTTYFTYGVVGAPDIRACLGVGNVVADIGNYAEVAVAVVVCSVVASVAAALWGRGGVSAIAVLVSAVIRTIVVSDIGNPFVVVVVIIIISDSIVVAAMIIIVGDGLSFVVRL